MKISKDNPQLRPEVSLAYLAGIVDGEGSILLSKSAKNRKTPGYRPRVSIANTSKLIIAKVKSILNFFDIDYCLYIQDVRKHQNHKTFYVHISKMMDVFKVLELLAPYLVGKKRKMEILLTLKDWKACSVAKKEQVFNRLRKLNVRIPKLSR